MHTVSHQQDCSGRRSKWSNMPRGTRIALMAAAALVFVPAFLALFGFGTMWLWNWLMPTIFHLPAISFWQAVGILLLSRILFKGGVFGRAGSNSWKKARVRAKMADQISAAQPE